MKITVSVIKADVGSIGGHTQPSPALLEAVGACVREEGAGLLLDVAVSHTGDDVAILMTHDRGVGDEQVHKLAWQAFVAGTEVAKAEGLYGAGQDLLKDAFSGNVKGMGPAVAEMEIDERPAEPFLFFAADKTDPGAYNLPLYLAFADPMNTPGLMLAPKLAKGFRWVVMDVEHTGGDRVIELVTPEELYDLAALLRDTERFVVESVWSRATGEQAAAVLHLAPPQHRGQVHREGRPGDARADPDELPGDGGDPRPVPARALRRGGDARLAQPAAHAGGPPLRHELLRRPALRELRGVLDARGEADRARGRVRAPVLAVGPPPRGGEGRGDAPAGVLRRRHAADGRARVHGDRGEAGGARRALRGAAGVIDRAGGEGS
jgi:hypothetical protein